MHLVIRTLGRDSAIDVAAHALQTEDRLRSLSFVTQSNTTVLTTGLTELARSKGVHLEEQIYHSPLGLGGARIAGIEGVTTPWIGFLDDDVKVTHGSLSDLVRYCESKGLGAASGVVPVYLENTRLYRFTKPLLFFGIFKDERSKAAYATEPFPSHLLSGGIMVSRTDLTASCIPILRTMDATYGWGEDAELSMCLSKRAKLEMHPGVRGENLIRGVDIVTEDPRGIALGRARRYRRFALNHSTRRLDWFHYLFATIGVSAQAIAQGAPVEGIHIFVRETLYGIKQILSGPPYSV